MYTGKDLETEISGVEQKDDSGRKRRVGRPYCPPRVMSAERLEAAAGFCDPLLGYGKGVTPCGILGVGS